jgi:hypothetical protein
MSGFANRGPQDPIGPSSSYGSGPGLFDPSVAALGGGRTYVTVTARAGGTRAAATKLTAAVNLIGVCATAADSVSLPRALGGQVIYVMNGGAASAQVFGDPATNDTINGVAAGTGVALANGKGASYFSPAFGVWFAVLSA